MGKKKPGLRCSARRASGVELRQDDTKTIANQNHAGKADVRFEGAGGPSWCVVSGRDLWALRELIRVGKKGVTPIECPGPRWSAYVHNLRELGIKIETDYEPHDGPYPGTHGRYILQSRVSIIGGAHAGK